MKLHAQAGLLQRMLPCSIIERINRGETIADEHRCVTVLFTDVCGFTEMAARTDTATVLKFVNNMFDAFDAIADVHGIYKVATIGDAYYAVCGQEAAQQADHAVAMLRFATDVLEALPRVALPPAMMRASGGGLRIRIGMHCGPVQAGIVGAHNPQFTFLGDAVNTASRMESHGFPNCVHVRRPPQPRAPPALCRRTRPLSPRFPAPCGATTQLSEAAHEVLLTQGARAEQFEPCGERFIKGKGPMRTFLAKCGDWRAAAAATAVAQPPSP